MWTGLMRPGRALRCAIALGLVALGLTCTAPGLLSPAETAAARTTAAAGGRPNIVLITADDMNASDMAWMPKTRQVLQQRGVEITDFISNHPLCCPARAEILTGQMAHNNGVHHNGGRYGGYHALIDKGNHVGSWLKAAGYKTAFVGKHLNNWPNSGKRQPGWSVFDPFWRGGYQPYGVTMYNDGRPKAYPTTYTADLVGQLTSRYITRFSRGSAPFFIWTSQLPPHRMKSGGQWVDPIPARRHRSLYPDALPPSMDSPAYKEADVSDKPSYVQKHPGVSKRKVVSRHRGRIRSLRAVDDQVAKIVQTLARTGELANTYVFFTSDNGYLLGEHRLIVKNVPYEEAMQVPLFVRGPGLAEGSARKETYGLVDLAPTFADIAGVRPQRTVDGRSMLDTLSTGAPGYQRYLIQATHGRQPWWWRGVRSSHYSYVSYANGERELYDLRADPFQLDNRAGDPAYAATEAAYAQQLAALKSCSGAACYGPPAAP